MAADGKKAVLLLLSTRYADLMGYIARRYGRDIDADDVMQDAFFRIQQMPADIKIANPKSYLVRIAENLARDRTRSRIAREKTVVAVEMPDAADENPSPEHVVDYRQRLAILQRAVSELPERQKQVFLMHKFDGLSHSEIAAKLGITRSAVEKLVMKALAHCRDRMGDLMN